MPSSLFQKVIAWTRQQDGKQFIADVVSTLAIVAFLFAIDLFTTRDSIELRIWDVDKTYYRSFVDDFYRENDFPLPSGADLDPLNRIFKTSSRSDSLDHFDADISDLNMLNGLKRGNNWHGLVHQRIKEIESYFPDSVYVRRLYIHPQYGTFWGEESKDRLITSMRESQSTTDYLTFLVALYRSRTFSHQIILKNDGDVDLKQVVVTIPAPMSRLTLDRTNTLLYTKVMGSGLSNISEQQDRLTWQVPSIRVGESLGLLVNTRENRILDSDLGCTYETEPNYRISSILGFVALILSAILTLRMWCNGTSSKSH